MPQYLTITKSLFLVNMSSCCSTKKRKSCSSSCCKTLRKTKAMKRFSSLHPWTTHGAARLARGSDFTLGNFGPSWYEATDDQKQKRLETGYRGRGKYWGKMLGGALGSIGGMFVGGPKAAVLGGKLGSYYGDKWTGKGMYEGRGMYEGPVSNSLIAGSSQAPPAFQSVDDETGALIITHREYIADIFGNQAGESYKNRSYAINPGLERSFPWLSQIAQNYEEYEMIQCVYEYRSTVAIDVGSNGQVGTVVMATNYNAANRPFDDKNTMMQYDGSMSSKTTESMAHGVECDPSKKNTPGGLYTRANPVVTGQDLKTYDHGLFQIATIGLPTAYENDNIGELWVSYTVKLRKPRFFSGKGLNVSRDRILCNPKNSILTNLIPDTALGQQNNIGISFVKGVTSGTSTVYYIVFPASYAGNVQVDLRMAGSINGTVSALYTAAADETPIALHSQTTGNIEPISDMFGVNPGNSREPNFGVKSMQNETGSNKDLFLSSIHIKVSVATGGIDNALAVILDTGSGIDALTQIVFDICEYNTYDLAPTDRPKFVSLVTGNLVDPTTAF
jgi:hypothetical protein